MITMALSLIALLVVGVATGVIVLGIVTTKRELAIHASLNQNHPSGIYYGGSHYYPKELPHAPNWAGVYKITEDGSLVEGMTVLVGASAGAGTSTESTSANATAGPGELMAKYNEWLNGGTADGSKYLVFLTQGAGTLKHEAFKPLSKLANTIGAVNQSMADSSAISGYCKLDDKQFMGRAIVGPADYGWSGKRIDI